MKDAESVRKQQAGYIESCVRAAENLLGTIDTGGVEAVLLSGSVARGDFFPGEMGGMIDLTVLRSPGSNQNAEDIFGPNEDPGIPFHCIRRAGFWFQIAFGDFYDTAGFMALDEAKKFALLESRPLYDKSGRYEQLLSDVQPGIAKELGSWSDQKRGYIGYLLSDYKKDRWLRRGAALQLHQNLTTAIQLAVGMVFYRNGRYAVAEDRRLYYCLDLPELPPNFESVLGSLLQQDPMSLEDYHRREQLFKTTMLAWLGF